MDKSTDHTESNGFRYLVMPQAWQIQLGDLLYVLWQIDRVLTATKLYFDLSRYNWLFKIRFRKKCFHGISWWRARPSANVMMSSKLIMTRSSYLRLLIIPIFFSDDVMPDVDTWFYRRSLTLPQLLWNKIEMKSSGWHSLHMASCLLTIVKFVLTSKHIGWFCYCFHNV